MKKRMSFSTVAAAALLTACAGNALQRAAVAKPSYPGVALTPQILFDLLVGEIAGQRGDMDTAVRALGRVAFATHDPRVAERATGAALYAKNYDQARKVASLWMELQPSSPDAHEALAEIAMGTGDSAEAQRQFEAMLAGAGTSEARRQIYLRIAAVLARQQNRNESLRVMNQAVALHPDEAGAQFALAHLAVRLGELPAAAGAIDRALALDSGWEEAAIFKARILASQKDARQALTFYESYLAAHPKAAAFRLSYARYLIDLKQWDKALKEFRRVTELSPKDPDALYAVGLLALQTNQLNEAEAYLKRTLVVQPDNDQARLYLAQIAEQRKNYGDALRWYREIDAGTYYFEAQVRIASVLNEQGKIDDALAQLRGMQPDSEQQQVQVVLMEDQILRDSKHYDRSLKVLNDALARLPNNGDLLYARALVAEKLNMLDLHERDLRQVLKADPKNVQALNALGYTLADRTNRYQEAYALVEQALALKPDDPFIMDSMGWVYYRMGNNAKAVDYLKRALAIRNDAEISAHLGEVLWVSGERGQAETIWKRALHDTPDNEALLTVIKKFKP
jgi:tetratricopeptide (TPR) repeat protein